MADIICKVIELQDTGNHHGTVFYRNKKDVLFKSYRLKRNMSQSEVKESIHKHFWYNKESKSGNLDTISGHLAHPPIGKESGEEVKQEEENSKNNSGLDHTKEIRLGGSNYDDSSEQQINA